MNKVKKKKIINEAQTGLFSCTEFNAKSVRTFKFYLKLSWGVWWSRGTVLSKSFMILAWNPNCSTSFQTGYHMWNEVQGAHN